jgi:rhamnosyltransferase
MYHGMISLIIPVLNPGPFAADLCAAIAGQSLRPGQIVVLDSESDDGSVAEFEAIGAEIHVVSRREFDHGGTRTLGMRLATGDELLYLTQDAVPIGAYAFEHIATALRAASDIGVVYGRHVPRPTANAFGAHLRLFTYPETSHMRSTADVGRYGLRAAFNSNSFALYRRAALDDIGGFAPRIISGEDLHAAARMLLRGWRVSYDADAAVEHSHDYSTWAEGRQFFDSGVMHAEEEWLLSDLGAPDASAVEFARSEFAYLRGLGERWVLPRWAWRNVVRYAAYRLGRAHRLLPRGLKRRLTAHAAYWRE